MRLRLPKTKARLRREAARWVARLEGGSDPSLEQSFRAWYEADPAHSAAFDRVSGSYSKAGLLRHSEIARGSSLANRSPPEVRQPRYALAAAVALVLAVPAGLILLKLQGQGPFGHTYALLLATNIGETKQVTLADGSRITLDADSAVRVELQRSVRHATLRRGRARFAVVPDPRPFTLEAGAAKVRMAEALVDAELAGNQARIEVLSGSAQVDAGLPDIRSSLALAQGQGLAAGPGGAQTYSVQTGRADWTKGMLQFNGTPLSTVAAEANRYSSHKLLLSAGLGQLRVSGAFRSGDNAGLARSLAAAFRLKLERTPEGNFLLSPNQAPGPEKKNGG